MADISSDRLQIAYEGPGIQNGRMQMLALANGLRAQALLIQRVGYLYFAKRTTIDVEVDSSFEDGSLAAPVHIVLHGFKQLEDVLLSPPVTAVGALLAILGFFKVDATTLYSLFKRLRGRSVLQPNDVPRQIMTDIPIDLLIAIYNDKDVKKLLRQVLEPLRLPGVTEFQTRRNGKIIERVSQRDLQAADETELADTKDEEIDLGIEKAAWRRDLDWHFTDGSTSFDASIDDDNFWEAVAKGEAFAVGDRMRVHLQTTSRRNRKGLPRMQRRIPKVLSVEHVRRQGQIYLFGDREP